MLRLAVCGLALMGVLAALGWRATPAHADGGAPVVACVLGAGNGGRDLAVIEIAARKVVALVSFDRASAAIALRGDSQVLYVAVPNDYRVLDDYRVLALDATTLSVQGTLPTGRGPDALAVGSAVTGNLFVANGGSGTVTVLDVGTARVLATIGVGAHPAGIAVAGPTSGIREACDAEVYVANSGANSVTVLSAVRRQVLATIPVPGGPCAIVVPATGGVANVGTRAGTVVALDLAAHAVLGPLVVVRGGATGQMDYDAITGKIYIPDAAGGAVAVPRPVPAPTAATAPTLPA